MTTLNRIVLFAFLVLVSACSSTEPKVTNLTGFWSGTTLFPTDPVCTTPSCGYQSRMMLFQTGNTVEGWYRARANFITDETPVVGTVRGDTLTLLINPPQLNLVGAVKFRILPGGENLEAINNGNVFSLALEK